MPGMIELRVDTDHPEKVRDVLIESKIDGAMHEWSGSRIISHRGIDRTDRFPHIANELSNLNIKVRGEIAIPFGHVLHLNKKANWHKARFYAFTMLEHDGQDMTDASVDDNRHVLETVFGRRRPIHTHLRIPFKWKSFQDAWAHVLKLKLEGTVLKERHGEGRVYKIKRYTETKIPVVGHTAGDAKGSFQVLLNGVVCNVSALSEGHVDKYNAMLAANVEPWAEIEYLFLTDNGKMFQPRLRHLGSKKDIHTPR